MAVLRLEPALYLLQVDGRSRSGPTRRNLQRGRTWPSWGVEMVYAVVPIGVRYLSGEMGVTQPSPKEVQRVQ